MVYLIILLLLIGYWYGLSLFFQKAGKTSWHAFVPYLRIKALTEIFEKKKWKWIIMSFIPVVNLFVYSNLLGEISNSIRRYDFWEHTLAVVFGWIWFPFILRKEEEKFHGIGGVKEGEEMPKLTKGREWLDAILFALFAAYFIRSFIFEIYTIPTSSMEGTLKVGDFLVVSKFHYGSRVPNTPVAFPLVHHSFPKWLPILGGKKSYLEIFEIPYKRLPKLEEIERNDMVVFNFPANDTTTKEYDSAWPYYDMVRQAEKEGVKDAKNYIKNKFTVLTRPVDKRENYIKRCVGLPGDDLEIKNGDLYIDNQPAWESEHAQFSYDVTANEKITLDSKTLSGKISKEFKKLDITEYDFLGNSKMLRIYTSKTRAKALEALAYIEKVEKYTHNSNKEFSDKKRMYPNTGKAFRNNVDNYGPITIPQKGMSIELNKENYLMYKRCISVYENNVLEIKKGKAYVNGVESKKYTFKMDYYWMMGDNRHRSQDSRYWGFVPEDHVVGKAWILILGTGKPHGFDSKRLFKNIHKKWMPKEEKYRN